MRKRIGRNVRNKTAIQFIPKNSRTPAKIPVLECPIIRPKKRIAHRTSPVPINISLGMCLFINGTEEAL
jgi:hypothetical protein